MIGILTGESSAGVFAVYASQGAAQGSALFLLAPLPPTELARLAGAQKWLALVSPDGDGDIAALRHRDLLTAGFPPLLLFLILFIFSVDTNQV